MLTVKYSKCRGASFISHIDMLRVLNRIFKRAGIKANYSKGFNPHMLVFMSSPLSLGMDSQAEYVTIDAIDSLSKEKFNEFSLMDIKAERIFNTEKNPNIAGVAVASSYVYNGCDMLNLDDKVNEIKSANSYLITYIDREKEMSKDVRNLIYDINVYGNDIHLLLGSGNSNLRADRFLLYFLKKNNIQFIPSNLKRTAQFVKAGDTFLNVDNYIEGLK